MVRKENAEPAELCTSFSSEIRAMCDSFALAILPLGVSKTKQAAHDWVVLQVWKAVQAANTLQPVADDKRLGVS